MYRVIYAHVVIIKGNNRGLLWIHYWIGWNTNMTFNCRNTWWSTRGYNTIRKLESKMKLCSHEAVRKHQSQSVSAGAEFWCRLKPRAQITPNPKSNESGAADSAAPGRRHHSCWVWGGNLMYTALMERKVCVLAAVCEWFLDDQLFRETI